MVHKQLKIGAQSSKIEEEIKAYFGDFTIKKFLDIAN